MQNETFFLPEGYRINQPAPYTLTDYWTPQQIYNAKYYQWDVYQLAARLIRKHQFRSLCDVGCGVGVKLGRLQNHLPGVSIWGMDQPEPTAYCRQQYSFGRWTNINLSQPDDVPESEVDLLVCADVIEHLESPDNLLRMLKRLVKPKGFIVLSTPDRERLRAGDRLGPPLNSTHIREWSKLELAAYVGSHGFKIQRHTHVAPVPFAFNRLWWDEVVWRWRHGKSARYNQVIVMSK